ncbi:MAG: hypothetical protein M1336_04520 [Deltaproteobacteria bacterium]|jgi:DNA-binding NarL/FixJ family response regulator|nr:hypothetical protein [Deltaproteobacteria bacterium]
MIQVVALVRDLLFRAKIDAAAEKLGVAVAYASTVEAAARQCAKLRPTLVVADLSDSAFPAAETVQALRTAFSPARLCGFASHVDLKALRQAREAGFEQTLSRSEFSARLGELLAAAKPAGS